MPTESATPGERSKRQDEDERRQKKGERGKEVMLQRHDSANATLLMLRKNRVSVLYFPEALRGSRLARRNVSRGRFSAVRSFRCVHAIFIGAELVAETMPGSS